MENNTQLLKGILEFCVLKLISREPTYGYEIVMNLKTGRFFRPERKHTVSAAASVGTTGKGHGRTQTFPQGAKSEILRCNRGRAAGAV